MFSKTGPDELKLAYPTKGGVTFTENVVDNFLDISHNREQNYRVECAEGRYSSANMALYSKTPKKIRKKINQQIYIYNAIQNEGNTKIFIDKKIKQLRIIAELYQALDDQYDDWMILQLRSYQVIFYDKFAAELARLRDYLSLTWQYEIMPHRLLFTRRFQEFFAGLPLAAMRAIMSELVKNNRLSSEIYADQESAEAQCFKTLLDRHTLTPLKHSHLKCFLLEAVDTQERMVLTVEHHLNQTKRLERKARKTLENVATMEDFFLPIYFERRARYFDPKFGHSIGRLILTQYCNQGNIYDFMQKHAENVKDHLEFALNLILILGEKLKKLQENGLVYTDLNGTNILVHVADESSEDISLHASNCNALYACDAQGRLMEPSGSTRYASVNADNIHVYQLGRCLYKFLISYDRTIWDDYQSEEPTIDVFSYRHFNYLVFKKIPTISSCVGDCLKNLIQNMVVLDPKKRVSLQNALSILKKIKLQLCEHTTKLDELRERLECLIQESRDMLDELLKERFGKNDWVMTQYVEGQSRFLVMDITKAEDIINRHSQLQEMLACLKTKDLRRIRQVIEELRKQTPELSRSTHNAFFKSRESGPALEIEAVMCEMPLARRKNIRSILASKAPEIQKVFQIVWPLNESCGRRVSPSCC